MRKIFTIIKKELKRFFCDKRILCSLIAPGFVIFIVYTLLGRALPNIFTSSANYTYIVETINLPQEYENVFETEQYKITLTEVENVKDSIEKIKNKEIDLVVLFDENFMEQIQAQNKPNVSIYYNSSSTESQTIYSYISLILNSTSGETNYFYYVNANQDIQYDLATSQDISAQLLSMLMPFLLSMLLFSGCIAITTESIAGEKERGTIFTLLITPTKRSHIAIGKIIALSLTSMVSAVFSFLGLILSLPNLVESSLSISLDMYTPLNYLCIFLILLITVILFTTILSIVSTFAKNVKEASQWGSVMMILVILLGVPSFINAGNPINNSIMYFIPILNSVQCIGSIFSLSFNPLNFAITILANGALIAIGIFVLAKMFNSEKIMSHR